VLGEGASNEVVERIGVNWMTVGKWHKRFLAQRLNGLHEEPRPGAPLTDLSRRDHNSDPRQDWTQSLGSGRDSWRWSAQLGLEVVSVDDFPVALVVRDSKDSGTYVETALASLVQSLTNFFGHKVVRLETREDAIAMVGSNARLGCVIVDWDLGLSESDSHAAACKPEEHVLATEVIKNVRDRNTQIPVFLLLLGSNHDKITIPLCLRERIQEYVWLLEDTPRFVAGRVDFALRQYTAGILPPFFRELKKYGDEHPYNWDAPGHMGGIAYLKSPAGRVFHDYYGENIFRTDIGINVHQMGSLLDHSGPVKRAEENAQRVFRSHRTFFVLNGSSSSNLVIGHGILRDDELVLVDRNCHKSVAYALTLTGAQPVYLHPLRNALGIIGPVPIESMRSKAVGKAIARDLPNYSSRKTRSAILTNCTYDGLCYDVNRVVAMLGRSVDSIHFDEAWFGYAGFHKLYSGRFAMGVPDNTSGRPTLYAVQSTHKMLAAFSQASMIHVKFGNKEPLNERNFNETFNEAYMTFSSTSPFYPMIASIDVGVSMMGPPGGTALVQEAIVESIRFRKEMAKTHREIVGDKRRSRGERWFFDVWQPESIESLKTELELATRPELWHLEAEASWHGFDGLSDAEYCMLDPTKVTIVTPGLDARGKTSTPGIPAAVVVKFLDSRRRIEISKAGDYTILIQFSIGTTKGKWGTLIDALLEFKRLYDGDVSLDEAIPDATEWHPEMGKEGLKAFCSRFHQFLCPTGATPMHEIREEAYQSVMVNQLAAMSPRQAHQETLRDRTELVMLDDVAGRISAVMVVPYPPGIPIVMPGEKVPAEARDYLKRLDDQRRFGLLPEIHGRYLDEDTGVAGIRCVREQPPE
jgi:arginine decarboxylase